MHVSLHVGWIVAAALAAAGGTVAPSPSAAAPRVVFVCQHGNVKSLIAAQWFDRLAGERGLSTAAVARGLTPETPVPPAIAEHLRADGFDVGTFEPRALVAMDVEGAARVVLIGAAAPEWLARTGVPFEKWEGVPPASERYADARDALRQRIESLLDALESRAAR